MADIVNLSNAESPLYATLLQTSARDPFTYSVRANVPSLSKNLVSVNVPNPSFGFNHTVEIPRYGLLSSAILKVTFSFKGSATASVVPTVIKQLMNYLVRRCDLQTHNKSIETTYNLYHQAFIHEMPYGQRESEKIAGLEVFPPTTPWTKTNGVTNTATGYLRLPCSFSYRTENFLDTRFLEQLSLNIETETFANLTYQMDAANSKIDKMAVIFQFINPEEQAYLDYRDANFPRDKYLSMLYTNRYLEQPSIAAGNIITTELKCQNLIYKTHIMLRNKTDVLDAAATRNPAIMSPITKIIINGSGRELINVDGDMLLYLSSAWGRFSGTSSTMTADPESLVYTINWGLDNDRTTCSGALSMRNVTAPMITVEFNGTSGKTYQLDVLHEYFTLVEVNGSNGQVSTGVNI